MTIDELMQSFSGTIVRPEDATYAGLQNTMFFKGAPAIILQAKNAEDIALAIHYAAEHDLKLSVRSGGHSGAGFSTNQKGLVVDLSYMKDVQIIDKSKHIVRIEGGAVWGDIAKELHKHGLALSSGDTLSVGVGGLTLGAGVGWMVRKFGLAIDSLVAADVVTADGKLTRASEAENPDLFWAIRGGGGNFGIVVAFEFNAHPMGKVFAGHITFGLDNLPELIAGWRDAMRTAPEELTTMLLTMPSFMGMPPSAMVMCCYAGDDKEKADQALKPFRQLGKVLGDAIQQKEYYEVLEEAHPPEGMKIVTKNTFIPDFSDELVKTIADLYADKEAGPILQIRSLGGAMNRVSADAMAFGHRDSEALIVSPVFLPSDASDQAVKDALVPWQKIAAFGSGAYINFFTELDEDVTGMYAPANYKKLVSIKKKYDPQNIFSQNYNIKPS